MNLQFLIFNVTTIPCHCEEGPADSAGTDEAVSASTSEIASSPLAPRNDDMLLSSQ